MGTGVVLDSTILAAVITVGGGGFGLYLLKRYYDKKDAKLKQQEEEVKHERERREELQKKRSDIYNNLIARLGPIQRFARETITEQRLDECLLDVGNWYTDTRDVLLESYYDNVEKEYMDFKESIFKTRDIKIQQGKISEEDWNKLLDKKKALTDKLKSIVNL